MDIETAKIIIRKFALNEINNYIDDVGLDEEYTVLKDYLDDKEETTIKDIDEALGILIRNNIL